MLKLEQARPSPLTGEALRRIGTLYGIEEAIRDSRRRNGFGYGRRKLGHNSMRWKDGWLRKMVTILSRKSDTTVATLYALNRWQALTRYCDDGTSEIDNSAAERALRGVTLAERTSCLLVRTRVVSVRRRCTRSLHGQVERHRSGGLTWAM